MKVQVQKQRLLNYMAKAGWFFISEEEVKASKKKGIIASTTRVYMTPQGNFMIVVMDDEKVIELTRREDLV